MLLTKLFMPDGNPGGTDGLPAGVTETDYIKQIREENKARRLAADELAKKNAELQAQIDATENDKLTKNKEFEVLANKYKLESDEAKAEALRLKKIEENFQTLQTQRRSELVSQLPDEETKAIAAKISDVALLGEYVQSTLKLIEKKVHTDGGRSGNFSLDMTKIATLKQLTWDQQEELKKSNPLVYNELFKKTYKQ